MLGVMSQPYQRLGLRMSIDAGNKPDVDEVDFLGYVADREDVQVVGLHLESIADLEAFLRAARRVTARKPVVLFKPGRTAAGAAASTAHTGSTPGDDALLDAGLRQAGLIRAYDFEEFIAFLRAFSSQPIPRGERLGIVTYSGALGVVASDEAVEHGLALACWAPETQARLQGLVPEWQPVGNPADLWVAVDTVGARTAQAGALEAVLADPYTDALLAIILAVPAADFEDVRDAFATMREAHPDKPLFLVLYGGPVRERWLREIEGLNIPVFPGSGLAIRALRAMCRYAAGRAPQ